MMEANHINNENNRMRSSSWMKLGVIVSVLSAIVVGTQFTLIYRDTKKRCENVENLSFCVIEINLDSLWSGPSWPFC